MERVVKSIPMSSLVLGKGQIRLRNVDAEVDELAESIAVVGLLEPILVAPLEGDKFEVLAGQRRFLAHEKLGRSHIDALVSDPVDETRAKVISLTENLIRRDPALEDKIDACTALFKKYGSVAAVSRETGIAARLVSEYVRYDQLDTSLKSLVDTGTLKLRDALRVQRAASVRGDFNPDDAKKLANEMSKMSGAQQSRLVQDLIQEPERPVDDVLEEQKQARKLEQIIVTLGSNAKTRLQRYASHEGTTQDDAARILIEEGLETKGFGEEEHGPRTQQ